MKKLFLVFLTVMSTGLVLAKETPFFRDYPYGATKEQVMQNELFRGLKDEAKETMVWATGEDQLAIGKYLATMKVMFSADGRLIAGWYEFFDFDGSIEKRLREVLGMKYGLPFLETPEVAIWYYGPNDAYVVTLRRTYQGPRIFYQAAQDVIEAFSGL